MSALSLSLRGLSPAEKDEYPDASCVVRINGRDHGGPISEAHYRWWVEYVWPSLDPGDFDAERTV